MITVGTDGWYGPLYLAGQPGHLSGQSNVWAVGQRTSTAGLFTGLLTVANLMKMRQNRNQLTLYKLHRWSWLVFVVSQLLLSHCCCFISHKLVMVLHLLNNYIWLHRTYTSVLGDDANDKHLYFIFAISLSFPFLFISLKGLITCKEQLSSGLTV